MEKRAWPMRILTAVWHGLDRLRRLLHLIVLLFIFAVLILAAVGDPFSRDQYYLAAHADRVYMHPMGMVLLDGYSRYLPYYKSALDKLYIDYNVWTVGEYKSFVEPITRDGMSPQDEEASRAYLS